MANALPSLEPPALKTGIVPFLGFGETVDSLELVELAVPVKISLAVRPAFFHDVEPLLSQAVACLVIIGQLKSQCFIFRFVPAADDIDAGAPVTDLVQRSQLFRGDYGVMKPSMCRRKDRDIFS